MNPKSQENEAQTTNSCNFKGGNSARTQAQSKAMEFFTADSFDNLSLVVKPGGDLLILRRDRLPRRDIEDGLSAESRSLSPDELPAQFGFCNSAFIVRKRK